MEVNFIPLFNATPHAEGDVYAMLCEMGDQNGSVNLPLQCSGESKRYLKVYPRLIHYVSQGAKYQCGSPHNVSGI